MRNGLVLVGIVLIGLLSWLPVSAAPMSQSFGFFQGGYDEDAFVTGMFSGVDADGDGTLFSFPSLASEISTFSMSFSGNSLVDPFAVQLDELAFFGLAYELDGVGLGDNLDEGVAFIASSGFGFSAGPVPLLTDVCPGPGCALVDNPAGVKSTSEALIVVTKEVPEVSSLSVLTVGHLGLGIATWRNRKSA